MTAELGKLKELKFPKCVKGMTWEDCCLKLLSAASTRGRAAEAIKGRFMGLMPVVTQDATGADVITGPDGAVLNALTNEHTAMQNENKRAFAELLMAMPGGRLTKIASKAKSPQFPDGCVFTAIKNLKTEISKVSPGNKSKLKNLFEKDKTLDKRKNPAKHLDGLIDVRDELEDEHNHIKSDEDIIDQMLKVLGSDWNCTKMEIKKKRRNNEAIDLKALRDELCEEFYVALKGARA